MGEAKIKEKEGKRKAFCVRMACICVSVYEGARQ